MKTSAQSTVSGTNLQPKNCYTKETPKKLDFGSNSLYIMLSSENRYRSAIGGFRERLLKVSTPKNDNAETKNINRHND